MGKHGGQAFAVLQRVEAVADQIESEEDKSEVEDCFADDAQRAWKDTEDRAQHNEDRADAGQAEAHQPGRCRRAYVGTNENAQAVRESNDAGIHQGDRQ